MSTLFVYKPISLYVVVGPWHLFKNIAEHLTVCSFLSCVYFAEVLFLHSVECLSKLLLFWYQHYILTIIILECSLSAQEFKV